MIHIWERENWDISIYIYISIQDKIKKSGLPTDGE
ncbi:MAG: hypothetical protein ACI8RD_007995 [Bacillariaceae sp.]|jgi:hypothetical protein